MLWLGRVLQRNACFPTSSESRLASIYSISEAGAGDLNEINSALAEYESDIEFVEAARSES